jgi:DNA-binding response OmpR family regulator
VDDEESIREMVRDGLAARGMRVEVAATGEEALCLMESRSYDAVLCDVNLRSVAPSAISGQELYSRIARGATGSLKDRKPLFVFMTGDLAERTVIQESTGEEVHTLQKPFRISELAALLSEVFAKAHSPNSQTIKRQ